MGERDEAEAPAASRLFNQDVGLPPLLEPSDVDRRQRSLAGCSWPGFTPAPLFVPYICGPMRDPGQPVGNEPCKWRVSLEVAHFFPSEISLSVRDGFLEVGGKHEERPDEHGFIARCFTRKYRLPADIDVAKFVSVLSVDGVLTVEAPVPKTSVPSPTVIPIKVELEVTGEKLEKCEASDTEPENRRTPQAQSLPSAEEDGEESQQEVGGLRVGTGSAAVGPEQDEEEEEEQGHEESSAESRPPAVVDGDCAASPRGSPEPREDQQIHTEPPGRGEPAVDGETRAAPGSGEAPEVTARPEGPEPGQTPPSEGPSRELEAAGVEQEGPE